MYVTARWWNLANALVSRHITCLPAIISPGFGRASIYIRNQAPPKARNIFSAMAPSGSKKRHRVVSSPMEPEESAPIVYASPGLKPDVRIRILSDVYHVHSIILKLHSNYFRRFLDSPEKTGTRASAEFEYEYVAVFDEDGTFALEPATAENTTQHSGFGDVYLATQIFPKLLSAMYNRPYKLESIGDLLALTTLADFHCALPIVSSSTTAALLNGQSGTDLFFLYDDSLRGWSASLTLAKNIRNPVLFRECFIHLVGLWDPDHEDEEIKQHPETYVLVLKEHGLFDIDELKEADRGSPSLVTKKVGFYRKWKSQTDSIMANNLLFGKGSIGPGQDYLLCAQISDDDMPWNKDEIDW
ncbi:hypothetical protein VTL71DRAFT_13530 [Oculimacula yallundae]|uniref:BTB domain-containing protein n=1 Tax=Oculimacula yallundae TaxID=86028 RepID=A0ABR4CN45_9HELO